MRLIEHGLPAGGGGAARVVAPPAAAPPERIQGLDLWRAILMLFGIVRHGVDWHMRDPLLYALFLASASFRMGTFFCISGLLTGYALLRHPPERWLRNRVRQLAVPLVFGLVVLCPLLSLLIGWTEAREGAAFVLRVDWYHLWFLVALILYSMGAIALHRLDARTGAIAAFLDAMRTAEAVTLAVGLGTFLAVSITTAVLAVVTPPAWWPPLSQVRWIVGYAALFYFGFLVSRSESLRRKVVWQARLACVTIALLVAFDAYAFGYLPGIRPIAGAAPLAFAAGTSLGPVAVSLLILRSAFAVRHVPGWLRLLAEGAFTIYLLHLPYLALAYAGLSFVHWGVRVEYLVAVLFSCVLSLATHVFVVRRSRLAAFLLNGRPLSPAVSPPPDAGGAAGAIVKKAGPHAFGGPASDPAVAPAAA